MVQEIETTKSGPFSWVDFQNIGLGFGVGAFEL